MHQMIYISKSVKPMLNAELEDLLVVCRANNMQQKITGMLLYADQQFIQVLEGEQNVVEALYEKIAKDERHSNAEIVLQRTIESREFSKWAMGFRSIEGDEDNYKQFYESFFNNDFAEKSLSESGGLAHELLISFRDKAA